MAYSPHAMPLLGQPLRCDLKTHTLQ